MIWTPHVTVAAVVEKEGRYLLVEESNHGSRVYNQPAGHLELGESLVEAIIRETLEETASDLRPTALVGIYRWVNPENVTYIRFCFTGVIDNYHPHRKLDVDIIRTWWLTRQEITELSGQLRSPLVSRCVDDYLSGRRYPLTLCIDV